VKKKKLCGKLEQMKLSRKEPKKQIKTKQNKKQKTKNLRFRFKRTKLKETFRGGPM
jgi:hypothetical protein